MNYTSNIYIYKCYHKLNEIHIKPYATHVFYFSDIMYMGFKLKCGLNILYAYSAMVLQISSFEGVSYLLASENNLFE